MFITIYLGWGLITMVIGRITSLSGWFKLKIDVQMNSCEVMELVVLVKPSSVLHHCLMSNRMFRFSMNVTSRTVQSKKGTRKRTKESINDGLNTPFSTKEHRCRYCGKRTSAINQTFSWLQRICWRSGGENKDELCGVQHISYRMMLRLDQHCSVIKNAVFNTNLRSSSLHGRSWRNIEKNWICRMRFERHCSNRLHFSTAATITSISIRQHWFESSLSLLLLLRTWTCLVVCLSFETSRPKDRLVIVMGKEITEDFLVSIRSFFVYEWRFSIDSIDTRSFSVDESIPCKRPFSHHEDRRLMKDSFSIKDLHRIGLIDFQWNRPFISNEEEKVQIHFDQSISS